MITGKPICSTTAKACASVVNGSEEPGTDDRPDLGHRPSGGDLVAHLLDHRRRGADEREAALFAGLRETGVLGQKAVPRMDRVGPRDLRRGDQAGMCR